MDEQDKQARFEELIMPHLDAAYNLARWLTRNEHDAQDVVQDSFLRAFKSFGTFRGGNGRSWLLTIVRNATYTWLQKNRKHELATDFDDSMHAVEDPAADPMAALVKSADLQMLQQAVENLPVEFREVTVLRELEGMAYKDIAEITGVPMGTVMSRLARARKQLQSSLAELLKQERRV